MTSMPDISEEDAFAFIVQFLQTPPKDYRGKYGYDVYIPDVMYEYLRRKFNVPSHDEAGRHYGRLSAWFYAAAWEMCRRGILRPGVRSYNQQVTEDGSGGNGYSITPAGTRWLTEAGARYDYVPVEPGRFAALLDQYAARYGQGFKERSQEAVRCYGAHAYLACCAMCGAAAESIFLAVAIAKDRDAAKIEKMYLAGGGRGRVEKLIVGSLAQPPADEFKGYVSLLKYWRDNAAHGMASGIKDPEAYTALAILLRFAQFTNDRWAELTA